MVSSTVGSPISTRWKRRARALSRSRCPRYSWKVVAPMQRSRPEARAGLSRLDASMVPPLVAPAPMMVWISSMKRMLPGCFSSALSTALMRFSKSPRNLVPASSAPMSSEYTVEPSSGLGASPLWIFCASPSTMAVFPTPASPMRSGLFLRRRARIWMDRATSLSRPTSGSMRPSAASLLRLRV